MSKPGEFEIIERYFAPLAGEGSLGFKDDAALFDPRPGHSLVITQDAIAENVHFLPDDPPAKIAQKAIRVNLSDLAAKGATPVSFSLALGLGERWDEEWIEGFADGVRQDCATFGLDFSGGDTFSTKGGTIISVTAIGDLPRGQYTSRLGAKVGDHVYVSGTIGDGALGLLARRGSFERGSSMHIEFLKDRYWLPQPRLECVALVRDFATASMDISDGLVGDCGKLAKASGVQIQLQAAMVPFSDAADWAIKDDSSRLQTALTGGDDYEILLCVSEKNRATFETEAVKCGVAFTRIGRVFEGEGIQMFDKSGDVMGFARTSYDHTTVTEGRST